jgi:hypothetical protein
MEAGLSNHGFWRGLSTIAEITFVPTAEVLWACRPAIQEEHCHDRFKTWSFMDPNSPRLIYESL